MANTLTIEQVMSAATAAGTATANGADGIMHLAKVAFGATRAKLIDDKSVKDLYVAYLRAANKSEYGSTVNVNDDKALKFGTSKLRVFVKFAGQKGKADDVWNLVRRTVGVINKGDTEGKRIGSRYEQVLKVIRTANKAGSAKLTDAQIVDALTPKAADIDDIAHHELEQLVKRVKSILAREGDKSIPSPATGYFASVLASAEEQLAQYRADFNIEAATEDETSEDEIDLDADDLVATLAA